jgi:hypothetical protein
LVNITCFAYFTGVYFITFHSHREKNLILGGYMKLLRNLLMTAVMLTLVACGGGSGSSSDNAGTDDSTDVEIKTTLSLTGTPSGFFDDSLSRATAISVTLTLADGTTYQMTDDGNGEYSCIVRNYSEDAVGYVEAHAGDLVLKNFFSSLASTDGGVDLGATDPESTLFVDILQAYVGALEANNNSASAAQLLAGFSDATLDIDVTTFRESVENDGTFESLRQSYTNALTWQNAENGVSVSTVLASAFESSEIYEEISTGGFVVPASSNDAETASEIIGGVFNAYATGDITTLAASLSTDFLSDGYDAEHWLANIQSELTDMEEAGLTMTLVSSDAKAVKVDDTTYKVFIASHTQLKLNGEVVEEENFDDSKEASYKAAPMYVTYDAATQKWALIGNQKKSEFWVNMGFYDTGDGTIESRFWADVTETDLYPIDNVYLDAGFFPNTVELFINPNDDSNEYHLYTSETYPYYYTGNQQYDVTYSADICAARDIDLHVDYADGTTDGIELTLPACPTEAVLDEFIPTLTVTQNTDGTVTFAFTHTDNANVSEVQLDVYDNEGGYNVFEGGSDGDDDGGSIPFDTTSIVANATTFTSGHSYNANFEVFDVYGRVFGVQKQFTY